MDDTADLARRIEAGASVRTLAAELGVTERTVRNRIRRAGIALPSERKAAAVNIEAVPLKRKSPAPRHAQLADRGGCSSGWPTTPASSPWRRNSGPAPGRAATPCDATG